MIIFVDIDGTIADNSQRHHLIPEDRTSNEGWAAFSKACSGDAPRYPVINLVRMIIAGGAKVKFLTGRGYCAHSETLTQLKNWFGISRTLIDLTMRDMSDTRSNADFKTEVITAYTQAYDVVCIDDDPTVVEALRKLPRVTVLQVDTMCAAVKNA